ncbi:MAG: YacL family protein [Thalassotalea sp.]|nr:YacL family protein [Thalassotalea sp.]
MEYEFIHDVVTGGAKAKFSLEHQIIGPWLEIELGQSTEKLAEILTAIDHIESGKWQEKLITGHEYSLVVSHDDVHIQANALLNGEAILPEEFSEDGMNFDGQDSSSCGVDDFRALLLSWAKFTKIP